MLAAFSLNVVAAVDGVTPYKFGMNIKTVKHQKKCSLEKAEDETYYCEDYPLGKIKTNAFFYFISGKLERVAISLPVESVDGIAKALMNKYPLSSELPEEVNKPQPNQIYDMGFEDDTVLLRFGYENDMEESVWLIYTTPDFNEKLSKQQADDVKDEL